MTSLLERIRLDALQARKARNPVASALLITLHAEAASPGLNDGKRISTDAEVLATVRKFLKGNAEVLAIRADDPTGQAEKALLENYLPQQLSEAEIKAAVEAIASELGISPITAKDTGALMKALSARHAGQYSGALASQIIKTLAQG